MVSSFLFVYLAVGLYAFFYSERMMFLPQPASYQDTPEILKLPVGENIRISALHLPRTDARYTLLYSHGNAEDLGDILPKLNLLRELGFGVFAYDYQGYGTSDGHPSEAGAYRDIDAAYEYMTQQLGIPPEQIVVYGRSIGGGPAVDLAARQPVGGVILESTFVTAFRVLTRVPLFPFDRFANLGKIDQIEAPILIVHGTEDEVIPFWHGEQLYARAREPKQAVWIPGARHNDILEVAPEEYEQALRKFLQELP